MTRFHHFTNLFAGMRETVLEAMAGLYPDLPPALLARIEVTPARDLAHGDMTTNAAMVAAKAAGVAPKQIAARLEEALAGAVGVAKVEQAGPGFVNLWLDTATLLAQIPVVLTAGEGYGDSETGGDVPVNVEYVSANPTGPMHIGHCRGAVVGDALANLLKKAGYAVTKEYYINDAGAQVQALAWAAYWRYLQVIGTTMTEEQFSLRAPGGLQYKGEYLIPVGGMLAESYGTSLASADRDAADPSIWRDIVQDVAVTAMMQSIREDLDALGVRHDIFTSEKALVGSGAPDRAVDQLSAAGLIYQGVLEPPKGKTPEDWEAREQTLFRATQFGDDVDRPLRKSDGSNTYFCNDIAYHADKMQRGATVLIDVLGADHGGYVSRMAAAVKALDPSGASVFQAVLCQIVHVVRDGQPVKMSKRAGSYVTLRDLIEEVGRDAVRFTMLTRKADAQMEFDLNEVIAQTRENPVFYVQYAHARCRSVLRAAAEAFGPTAVEPFALANAQLDSLTHEAELAMVRRLMNWPRLVETAAVAREPHRIAFFLQEVAADLHGWWNRGREDTTLRFLQPERPAETMARLALVEATATVIRSGLAVLGVTPVEEMR